MQTINGRRVVLLLLRHLLLVVVIQPGHLVLVLVFQALHGLVVLLCQRFDCFLFVFFELVGFSLQLFAVRRVQVAELVLMAFLERCYFIFILVLQFLELPLVVCLHVRPLLLQDLSFVLESLPGLLQIGLQLLYLFVIFTLHVLLVSFCIALQLFDPSLVLRLQLLELVFELTGVLDFQGLDLFQQPVDLFPQLLLTLGAAGQCLLKLAV